MEAARRKWDGADNPLHEDRGKEATKEAVDQRHLIRAKSGGFHKKPTVGGGRLGKKKKPPAAATATEEEAPPPPPLPPPPPPSETTWTQHVDAASGHPFYEDENGESSWYEPFAREGRAWRSLVDRRVVHKEPQNVI